MRHANNFSTARCFLNFVVALMAVLVSAQQTRAQDSGSELFGTRWTLTEMERRRFSADAPNIEFDREQERVSGSGGCNRFNGAFEIDGSRLKLSRIAATKRACLDAGLQRVETSFFRLLETTTRFEVQGDTLRLFAGNRPVLVFLGRVTSPPTPAPAPDGAADLGGTSWQLVKFEGGDGTTIVPDDGAKYTVAFGRDGRVRARIDCNRGGGSWESDGPNHLRLGPLALTRVGCPPDSLNNRMARDWTAVRSYVVRDGRLFLSLLADGGIYEFEPAGGAGGPQEGRVTGTVSYRQRIALRPGAVVEVRLLDISRAGAPSVTIAEQTIRAGGRQVPFAFELTYDPRRIDPRGRYAIQARIFEGRRLRFRNTDAYLVITGGRPNRVRVIVSPVGRR